MSWVASPAPQGPPRENALDALEPLDRPDPHPTSEVPNASAKTVRLAMPPISDELVSCAAMPCGRPARAARKRRQSPQIEDITLERNPTCRQLMPVARAQERLPFACALVLFANQSNVVRRNHAVSIRIFWLTSIEVGYL